MQMTLRIARSANKRHFSELVANLKDLDATYDGATKAWTFDPETSTRVKVWKNGYAKYADVAPADIVRDMLEVGKWYEEVS